MAITSFPIETISGDGLIAQITAARDLALAGSPYRLASFVELATRLVYSGATAGQITVAAGDVIDVIGCGAYTVAASGATDADLSYAAKLYALPDKGRLSIEQFGGGTAVGDNSPPANFAMAAIERLGGAALVFSAPGTYEFGVSKNNPYGAGKCCVDMTSDKTTVIVGPGATLKLSDGAQTDATGPVYLFAGDVARSGIRFEVDGAISNNKNGQPGWTGGYSQAGAGGCCVLFKGSTPGGRYEFMGTGTIGDCFSNPIDISAAIARGGSVHFGQITYTNCGEGPEIAGFDQVTGTPCYVLDEDFQMAGDGIEIARCGDVVLENIRVECRQGSPKGSALEFYGCETVTVQGYTVLNWWDLIGLGAPAGGVNAFVFPKPVLMNGRVIGLQSSTGIVDGYQGLTNPNRIVFDGLHMSDSPNTIPLYVTGDSTAEPIEFYNVKFDNCKKVIVLSDRHHIWHGGGNANSSDVAFEFQAQKDDDARSIDWRNLDFTGSVSGARINSLTRTGFKIKGVITNCHMDTLAQWPNGDSDVDYSELISDGNKPDVYVGTSTDIGAFMRCQIRSAPGGFVNEVRNPSAGMVLQIMNQSGSAMTLAHDNSSVADAPLRYAPLFNLSGVNDVLATGHSRFYRFLNASEAPGGAAGMYEIG
ncbi:hypothetical protein SAMN05877809_105246 [Rhodobacter sp. JA431]|uniref:hypothetical protein n=1 Tax=Rhodobacter sp. JA431 TaxID=570013 RepID=UPI000BC7CF36|nr:hypothetical protein [Rhodobacter sp. JA431]SOC11273.1 hypothetical protein SAMN05877809_105246 [Rhodobacter sp. JA431]